MAASLGSTDFCEYKLMGYFLRPRVSHEVEEHRIDYCKPTASFEIEEPQKDPSGDLPQIVLDFIDRCRLWLPLSKTRFEGLLTSRIKRECPKANGTQAYGYFVNSQIARHLENFAITEVQPHVAVKREAKLIPDGNDCDVLVEDPTCTIAIETDNARLDQIAKSAWLLTPQLHQSTSQNGRKAFYIHILYATNKKRHEGLVAELDKAAHTFRDFQRWSPLTGGMFALAIKRTETPPRTGTLLVIGANDSEKKNKPLLPSFLSSE